MSNELIQVVDCLNKDQVARVLSILETAPWEPTTIFGKGEECVVDTNIRSNTRYCPLDDTEVAGIMHEGMNEALLRYRDTLADVSTQFVDYPVPGTRNTSCWRESIQVLKYETAEYYTWHSDQATNTQVSEFGRTISVVLYLQNATVGGRTQFTHRSFRPKAGQALIFPSNWCYPHQCEPIIEGTKIAAVTWYHSHTNYQND